MKEFIEKLIERLEECEERYDDVSFAQLSEFGITLDYKYAEGKRDGVAESISIVNELAEEHINASTDTPSGWIACSERLPEKNQRCLVSYKGNINSEGIEEKYVDIDRFEGTRFSFFGIDRVIAWQSLPAPYKEGVTENE